MSKNNLYKHKDSYKFNIITNIKNKVKRFSRGKGGEKIQISISRDLPKFKVLSDESIF